MSLKKKLILALLALMILIAGICMMIYPLFAVEYADKVKSEVSAQYDAQIAAVPNEEIDAARAAAQAYNHDLFSGAFGWLEAEENGYFEQLDLTGSGIMGYISIPKIDVYLPIYHGIGQEDLAKGAGHMSQSSLPIGGENTHSAISAHSGTAAGRMFTELGQLELGDTFHIKVLGETLTYEVDDMKEVLPVEVSSIMIVPGEDLCTLITCTPIGVNTHRLLVRGHRIEAPAEPSAEDGSATPTEADPAQERSLWAEHYFKSVITGVSLSLSLLLIVVIVILVFRNRRKKSTSPLRSTDSDMAGDHDA